MSEVLKPCIFCKSDKKLRIMAKHYTDESHIWWVECARCGACGMHSHEYERAIESWNAAWDTCAGHEGRCGMSRYFLCDYCEHAKDLDVFNANCAKYGVIAKRVIGDGQQPREVCDCYAGKERKNERVYR